MPPRVNEGQAAVPKLVVASPPAAMLLRRALVLAAAGIRWRGKGGEWERGERGRLQFLDWEDPRWLRGRGLDCRDPYRRMVPGRPGDGG